MEEKLKEVKRRLAEEVRAWEEEKALPLWLPL